MKKYRVLFLLLIITFVFASCSSASRTVESESFDAAIFVVAGNATSYVICSNNYLWGWGSNRVGQIGNGQRLHHDYPQITHTRILDNVIYVSANGQLQRSRTGSHVLAIRDDNSLWAWGENSTGQVGVVFPPPHQLEPVFVMDNVAAVSAGGAHSMAIGLDGSLWVWGDNSWGQLGNGTIGNVSATPVKIMEDVMAASAGVFHSAAITSDGDLWVWGANPLGQIGDGTTYGRIAPTRVKSDVVAISLGLHFTLAITSNSELWAWGSNTDGILGDGVEMYNAIPIKLMDDISYISAGHSFALAIDTNDVLWAWGNNDVGQLGDGTTISRNTPVKIMEDIAYVSVGGWISTAYAFAIDNSGALWAWGDNFLAQLGDGTMTSSNVPVRVR